MRGPLSGVVVVLVLAAFQLLVVAAQDDDQVEKLTTRIGRLTGSIVRLQQKIEERINPERIQKAGSLTARVDAIAEPTCEPRNFQCGGNDPQCISNLLVCDLHNDCRNGEDEKHCDVPVKRGDTFVGDKVYDNCGLMNPEHITVVINSVSTGAIYASHPELTATLNIHADDEDDDHEVAIPTKGYYDFATHKIIFGGSKDDALYLVGQFDGHNFDKFDGESTSVGTGAACARYIYKRQH